MTNSATKLTIMTSIAEILHQGIQYVWKDDLHSVPWHKRYFLTVVRLLYVTIRELFTGELTLAATSLVYTTLLSIVPLLAVSFSILKAFGVHNTIEPTLMRLLEPLGPQSAEITGYIIGFVQNVKVGVLGALGLAFLLYTVVAMLQKIESVFNRVWHVHSLRQFSHRFSIYLTVVLIGPVLIFSAIGITASVTNNSLVQYLLSVEPLGTLYIDLSRLLPYVLVWAAFSFLYIFIPNTDVKLKPALIGGLIAAVLWQTAGWVFAHFIASSSKYAAIYSSFAVVILVLIWLYVNWLIVLVGAKMTFFIQNPRHMSLERIPRSLSSRMRDRVALMVMLLVGKAHWLGKPPYTLDELSNQLVVPLELIENQVKVLIKSGFLIETASDPVTYVPARDIDTIKLADLLFAIREAGGSKVVNQAVVDALKPVDVLLAELENSVKDQLGGRTLHDLLEPELRNL